MCFCRHVYIYIAIVVGIVIIDDLVVVAIDFVVVDVVGIVVVAVVGSGGIVSLLFLLLVSYRCCY